MGCYYIKYHSDSAVSWIYHLVNSKDEVYFPMLFTLRLLQRWGVVSSFIKSFYDPINHTFKYCKVNKIDLTFSLELD